MRVLQVMAGAKFGGAETFFTRLVVALRRAGLHQRVVIRRDDHRAEILRQGGIEPVELRFGGPLDVFTRMGLKREVESFSPNIVMTWMNRASTMCPKGSFVHVARLGGYYDLKYYQKCNHLIGNTEDIVGYLTDKGWPAERAHYLPNFVSASISDPLPREEFYTPNDAPLLLALGRLHENKAFDVLLDALACIPNAYLWLAGDGPKRAELEAQAEKLGVKPRVRFLGWRDDIEALLASCNVFVCPSRHEPLGNVVVEAWAQSKPVVAADSLGPGVLIDQNKNGVLVPINDAKSLANGIQRVLGDENLQSAIARNGRATYEEHFTESIVVEQYLSFFESFVDKD
jgi:glycosyltransferase involved in cell wall biosynthesis